MKTEFYICDCCGSIFPEKTDISNVCVTIHDFNGITKFQANFCRKCDSIVHDIVTTNMSKMWTEISAQKHKWSVVKKYNKNRVVLQTEYKEEEEKNK